MKNVKITTDKWKSVVDAYDKQENFEYKIFVAMTIDEIKNNFAEEDFAVKYDKENELLICYIEPNKNGFDVADVIYIPIVDSYGFYRQCLLEVVDNKSEHINNIEEGDKMRVMKKVVDITVEKIHNGVKKFKEKNVISKREKDLDKLLDIVEKW